jgi:hypothetical protein
LQQLVDRFCRENEDVMAMQQYEMVERDLEYFMRVVDLAVAYYRKEEIGKGKGNIGFKRGLPNKGWIIIDKSLHRCECNAVSVSIGIEN